MILILISILCSLSKILKIKHSDLFETHWHGECVNILILQNGVGTFVTVIIDIKI